MKINRIWESTNLKGEQKLNQYLHNWFATNCDFDLDFELGTDFEYVYVDDLIRYAFVVVDDHDRMFLDVCREIAPELVNCDNFLLSLFHEVGHYITQEDFDDDEWDDYDSKSDWGSDYDGYYHHPIEYEATRAGIELMMENQDKIPELLKNIQKYELEIFDELGYDMG